MKFETLSRKEAENLSPCENRYPLISIKAPDNTDPDLPLDCYGDVLRLEFHDVDGYRHGMKMFNENQAYRILKFVEEQEGQDVMYVHCLAGQSRSVGVAVALNEIVNGITDLPRKWQTYNRHVYRVMMNRAGRGKSRKTYEELFSED
jgi:predicted protein tyrosine phosphatase